MKEAIKRNQETNLYISNYGKAFKFEDNKLIEVDTTQNGEKKAIRTKGKQRMNIDSLVWRTFIGETEGRTRLHIKHKDGNMDNNRLDNLELPGGRIRPKTEDSTNIYNEIQKKIAELEKKLEQLGE